jgi:hypothetical protein
LVPFHFSGKIFFLIIVVVYFLIYVYICSVKISEIESLNDASSPATLIGADGTTTYTASVFREGLEYRLGADIETLYSYTDNFFGDAGYAAVSVAPIFHCIFLLAFRIKKRDRE